MKKTLTAMFFCATAFSSTYDARVIEGNLRRLNPSMHSSKVELFAGYIKAASERYDVDPTILVAISFQESSFRENLPEGAAGELGVCQVQKYWVYDPRFIREFGWIQEQHLASSEFNYLAAAWILDQVRTQYGDNDATTPYWSYYNSVTPRYRVAYFKRVMRHLSKLSLYDVKESKTRRKVGGSIENAVLFSDFPEEDGSWVYNYGSSRSQRREHIPRLATCSQSVPLRPRRVQRS